MHVSKEFLLEAVGLSLLVALICISMQMFQRATKITTLLEESQEQKITELEEYEIVKYDGLLIDGMTAISYIKKMTGTYELPVNVTTEVNEFQVVTKEDYGALRDVDSNNYINPLAKYHCAVVRDENKVIEKICISVEREGN